MHQQPARGTPAESTAAPTHGTRPHATGVIIFDKDRHRLGEKLGDPAEREEGFLGGVCNRANVSG